MLNLVFPSNSRFFYYIAEFCIYSLMLRHTEGQTNRKWYGCSFRHTGAVSVDCGYHVQENFRKALLWHA